MQATRNVAPHDRALACTAVDFDPAAVQLNETIDKRQAKSGPGALTSASL
jgi:hypothetical protein